MQDKRRTLKIELLSLSLQLPLQWKLETEFRKYLTFGNILHTNSEHNYAMYPCSFCGKPNRFHGVRFIVEQIAMLSQHVRRSEWDRIKTMPWPVSSSSCPDPSTGKKVNLHHCCNYTIKLHTTEIQISCIAEHYCGELFRGPIICLLLHSWSPWIAFEVGKGEKRPHRYFAAQSHAHNVSVLSLSLNKCIWNKLDNSHQDLFCHSFLSLNNK